LKFELSEARRLILARQFPQIKAGGLAGTEAVFSQLGYVQIDTIHVIERAHHQVIRSRQEEYLPDWLDTLQKNRLIFEYWTHAMSYLPMSDFRFVLPRMKNFQNPQHPWFKKHLNEYGYLLPEVLTRIREEGPLSAQDFEKKQYRAAGWWDWKPAKIALELLLWQGELMISHRRNFQKVYDLTERVLPPGLDLRVPNSEESTDFIINRAVKSFGLATAREIARFMQPEGGRDSDMRIVEPGLIYKRLRELTDEGKLAEAEIENIPDQIYYYDPESLETKLKAASVRILSPFDNLVIQRSRLNRLFNFDYRLECYVPEKKREYGYFVLPVLSGQRFIGRMDVKADRKNKILRILHFWPEADFYPDEEEREKLRTVLNDFARFNSCDTLELDDLLRSWLTR